MKLLIKYKVDVNVADNVSIVFKFSYGQYLVDYLLYEFFFQEGWTPLHVAIQSRNRFIAKVLLVNGADKNRRTKVTF